MKRMIAAVLTSVVTLPSGWRTSRSSQRTVNSIKIEADAYIRTGSTFYGAIPNYGISYVDGNGAARSFAVEMSGEDGSVVLRALDG